MDYPIIPCDLCGSQDGLQRAAIKRMVDDWEATFPGPPRQILFRALAQVKPSHLLDTGLFDFAAHLITALTFRAATAVEPAPRLMPV